MSRRPAKSLPPFLSNSSTWKPFALLVVLAALLSIAVLAGGQVSPGMPSFSAYDAHAVDTINLQNLNIVLNVPGFQKSGAFPLSYQMQGNFYLYKTAAPTWATGAAALLGAANGALSAQPVAVVANWGGAVLCPDGVTYTYKDSGWSIRMADGTLHSMPPADYVDSSSCYSPSFTDHATDNSGYTLSVSGGGYTVVIYDKAGMKITTTGAAWVGSSITDPNSNAISQSGTSPNFTYTDTLGVTALTLSSSGSVATWTDVNLGSPKVSETLTSETLKTTFGCSGVSEMNTYRSLPTSVSYSDGTSLGISYEAVTGGYTGRLAQLTLRGGGTISYAYSGGNSGINCTYQVPPTLKRTTSDGTTEYDWAAVNNGSGNWGNTTTVIDNGGNKTVYTFTGLTSTGNAAFPVVQALTQIQHYQGSSTLLTTDLYCYNANSSNCSTAVVSGPITEVDVYHTINGMSNSSRTKSTFDTYGNVLISAQYDFGASIPTVQTTITYGTWNGSACAAVATYINNKQCDVVTTQGGNTGCRISFHL